MTVYNPLIGILLDEEQGSPASYSSYPWYGLRQNYMQSVHSAGGMPIGLPLFISTLEGTLPRLDGLVIAGGAFDIDPTLYGAVEETSEPLTIKKTRTTAELYATHYALQHHMPILGICGGAQLMAVALGGTLVQHIPDFYKDALPHEQPNPRHEASHLVHLKEGSLLNEIARSSSQAVNSAHHQSILNPGRAVMTAWAEDNIIEGIEYPPHPFFVGVQWHPEFGISAADRRLFSFFVRACRLYHENLHARTF